MTCFEAVVEGEFPNLAGVQTEAEVLSQGQEAPATFEQVGAEKAAREGQPEASVVQEGKLNLLVLRRVCFGFRESVFQQMPGRGSVGH